MNIEGEERTTDREERKVKVSGERGRQFGTSDKRKSRREKSVSIPIPISCASVATLASFPPDFKRISFASFCVLHSKQ